MRCVGLVIKAPGFDKINLQRENVELDCTAYREATVFTVKIALDANMSALQTAIIKQKKAL